MLVHAEREAARRAHGLEAARVVRGLAREAREAGQPRVPAGPTHTHNTGAYIHRLPSSAVNTAAQGNARTVRVQVLTPPGG
jgi:hypothetical protein